MHARNKTLLTLMLGLLLASGATLMLATGPASAHPDEEPQEIPRDFITGGGWFIIQSPSAGTATPGTRANFGWHGGVKNGDWWGNGNYRDHGNGLHARSRDVTGYVRQGTDGTDEKGRRTGTRDVCGIAETNHFGETRYRVRMKDNGEPGRRDKFGITLWQNGTLVYGAFGSLGDPSPGGGNIQLHKGNKSNTAPSEPADCPPDVFPFT